MVRESTKSKRNVRRHCVCVCACVDGMEISKLRSTCMEGARRKRAWPLFSWLHRDTCMYRVHI